MSTRCILLASTLGSFRCELVVGSDRRHRSIQPKLIYTRSVSDAFGNRIRGQSSGLPNTSKNNLDDVRRTKVLPAGTHRH